MVWRTRLSHKKNLSDVIRTGGHVIVIQFCGIALGFILQILLARWLGPGNYGAYVYSFAWITIVSILCGVGLPTSSVRFISENLEKKNWARAKGFYRWSLFLAICCSVLIMVFGFVTFGIYKSFLPRGVEEAYYISLLCIPFLSLLRLNIGVFRGFGYAVLAYWPDKLGRPALLIMAILAMEYFSIEMTAANVVVATALVLFILCVVQITIGEYRVPSVVRQSTAEYENSRWLKVSLPLVLVAGFQVIIDRTDLIVLGMYLDADTIAIYNAAARTAGLVVVILTAMNALSGAKIAALYNTGDLGGLHVLINGVVKWTFWPSLLLALLVMLLSDEIMSIFGAGFRDGK